MIEIKALLLKEIKRFGQNNRVETHSYQKLVPVVIEIEPKEEAHKIAIDFALKVLADLGIKTVITEDDYISLGKREKDINK